MKALVALGCVVLATAALAADAKKPETTPAQPTQPAMETASAEIKNAEGKQVGEAKLTQAPHGVIVHVKVWGIPEGQHAIHIHEVGKCEAPFKTAGAHFNPASHQHGIQNPKGEHAGDLPNLFIPKGGELETDLFTDAVTLTPGKASVFDADGSAIIIHASADDYKTDPAGNAGDRIACGVLKK